LTDRPTDWPTFYRPFDQHPGFGPYGLASLDTQAIDIDAIFVTSLLIGILDFESTIPFPFDRNIDMFLSTRIFRTWEDMPCRWQMCHRWQ
jgi:hypothetical protein